MYSPYEGSAVTLTGQLALLMLVERLWNVPQCRIINANTDGVTVLVHRDTVARLHCAASEWGRETEFNLEFGEYSAFYSRDVNNYVAVKHNGDLKRKGVFAPSGLGKGKELPEVCVDMAITALRYTGAPKWPDMPHADDWHKLCMAKNPKSEVAYYLRGKQQESLQKHPRWYWATDTGHDTCIRYLSNGNRVPRSDGCVPVMDAHADVGEWKVDRKRYITEAEKLVDSVHQNKMTQA